MAHCLAALRLIFFPSVLFILSAVECVFFLYMCESDYSLLPGCLCVWRQKGRAGSISTHGDSLCADLQCCIETEKLKSMVDALNDNAVILSKSRLTSSSSSSSSLPHQLAQITEELCLYPPFCVLCCTGTAELSREDMMCTTTVIKPHMSWEPRERRAAWFKWMKSWTLSGCRMHFPSP